MQCIVRTTLSHDVRLSVRHTMSVCPSVTHDVRLSHTMSVCPSVTRDVRLSVRRTMPVCPSVTHDARLSVHHTMSVRPSVTRLYCVKTAKRITVLSSSGRHTILVVPHSTIMAIFRRRPPNGSVECRGYEKIAILDQYLALSQK